MEKIIAIDVSGSISIALPEYIDRIKELINEYYDAKILFWNDTIIETTKQKLNKFLKNHQDNSGGLTNPEVFFEYLSNKNFIGKLFVFTDCIIPDESIPKCKLLTNTAKFDSVELYIYNRTKDTINMSFPSMLIKNSPTKVYINGALKLISSFYNFDDIKINTIPDYIENYEEIKGFTIKKAIGTGSLEIKNKLLNMRKNLVKKYVTDKTDKIIKNDIYSKIEELIKSNKFKEVYDIFKNIGSEYASHGEIDIDKFEASINELVSICDNIGEYCLYYNRLDRSDITRESDIYAVNKDKYIPKIKLDEFLNIIIDIIKYKSEIRNELALPETDEKNPININREVMMFNKDFYVFNGLDKKQINIILNNPFMILNSKILVDKILDNFYGFTNFDNILSFDKIKIILNDNDKYYDQITDYNNHALGKLFFSEHKLTGCMTLYQVVLWHILKNSDKFKMTKELGTVERHIKLRLIKDKTNIGLSGLINITSVKAPVGISIWYCLHTQFIINDGVNNRLKFFGSTAGKMKTICELINYPIDPNLTKFVQRVKLLSFFMYNKAKYDYYERIVKGLFVPVLIVDNEILCFVDYCDKWKKNYDILIEKLPKIARNMTKEEIYKTFKLVNINKTLGIIDITKDNDKIEYPMISSSYQYKNVTNWNVKLCPDTFRPYSKKCIVKASEQFGEIDKIFNADHYMTDYIMKYKAFPTFKQYVLYCENRMKNKGNLNSYKHLPYQILYIYNAMIEDYTTANKDNLQWIKIADILNKSLNKENRDLMERKYKEIVNTNSSVKIETI